MRSRFLIFSAIFILTFTLYLKTMPPTVFWQDSGVFLAGLKHFGIVYPPGFPLYLLLGVLWLKILSFFPLPLNFTQQVHAFSGLWGAGAAALVGLSVYELTHEGGTIRHPEFTRPARPEPSRRERGRRVSGSTSKRMLKQAYPEEILNQVQNDTFRVQQDTKHIASLLISIVSGLTAGLSYSLWSQSINAEIYSMIGFFAALIFFLVVKLIKNYRKPPFEERDFISAQKKYRKYLFLLALIWGLSFGVHLLTITFSIPLLWLFFHLRLLPVFKAKISTGQDYRPFLTNKVCLWAFLIFLFAALTPYLYLPIRSAANPQVMWAKIDSPQAFVTHVTGKDYRTAEGAISLPKPDKLRSYPILFWQEFFVPGILLGLLGLLSFYKSTNQSFRSFAVFGVIQAIVIYLLISFYERGTEYNFWLIPFYLYWIILVGQGLWLIVKKINYSIFRFSLLAALAIGLLVSPLGVNWPLLNRSHYTLAEEFGKNLIGRLPPNSVFFTMGDQESAIPLYLQKVADYRPDIVVTSDSDFAYAWRRKRFATYHPELVFPSIQSRNDPLTPEENAGAIDQFIAANIDKSKIFVITKNYLSLSPRFKLLPAGTIWQITKTEDQPIDLSFWNYSFSDPNRYRKPERPELERKKTSYAQGQPVSSYQRAPYSDEAKIFELQAKKNLGDLCYQVYNEHRVLKIKTTSGQIENWQEDKLLQCAIQSYEGMFKIDPRFYHRDIFLRLAELYKATGKTEAAKRLIEKLANP